MGRNEHVVIADDKGDFYCKAVDGILNCKREEQVCGPGCPYDLRTAQTACGRFVCRYEDEGRKDCPALFPPAPGLDEGLRRAYAYAAAAHRGQVRKGTKIPYFAHIIMTMNYAVGLTRDTGVLQAAILHDTIEDTAVTRADIRREFGERVAALVEGETENKRPCMPASETWELRKRETIEYLKDSPSEVKVITLADKTANLESIAREWRRTGDDIWKKFNQTDKKMQEWYFRSIREHLDEFRGTEAIRAYDGYIKLLF